jgi:anti-anti-sigma regulatory factor
MQVAEPVRPYTIHLEGVFDERTAARLSELLSGAPEGAPIAVDLSRVRHFQGPGLALLAGALAARTERLDVRGLGRHEERLLRYLGFGPGARDAPAASLART